MSREVPYDPDEICDVCGQQGAFDFLGDCVCQECIRGMVPQREEEEPE